MQTTEEYQREQTTCVHCGDDKSKGLILCWNCFKYIDNAFKYSELSFDEWLKASSAQAVYVNSANQVVYCPTDPQEALACEACQ